MARPWREGLGSGGGLLGGEPPSVMVSQPQSLFPQGCVAPYVGPLWATALSASSSHVCRLTLLLGSEPLGRRPGHNPGLLGPLPYLQHLEQMLVE